MGTSLKLFVDGASGSQLTEITTTDPSAVYTANESKDRRISQMLVVSTDTVDRTAKIDISDGVKSATLGKVIIPDGSGTNGTDAAVDIVESLTTVFTQVDNADNKYIDIPAGWSISITMSGVTTDKLFGVVVIGAAE